MLVIRIIILATAFISTLGQAYIVEKNFTAPAIKSSNLAIAPILRLLFSFGGGSSVRGMVVRQAFAQTAKRSAMRMVIKQGSRKFVKIGKSVGKSIKRGAKKFKKKV